MELLERAKEVAVTIGNHDVVALIVAFALFVLVVGIVLVGMARLLKCPVTDAAAALSQVLAVFVPGRRR